MSEHKQAIKLAQSNLSQMTSEVRVPQYDRSVLSQHIVHIGVGGFHRAHQAVYLDDLLSTSDAERWGECGMGLLPGDERMRDVLREQDFLYTLVERSAEKQTARVIGSIVDYIWAPADREAALERLAAPKTRIVSLTITEGGYFLDEGTGAFTASHPDIQHDVQHPNEPVTSLGFIAEALQRRRDRGLPAFTVMSCDNLQGNGHVIQRVLLEFAGMRDPSLQQWIADNVAFPNSMVDRITPATKPGDLSFLKERFGIEDGWPVVTEPFLQWVIEDTFRNGRPHWERFGAQMVTDVAPYELMKMRLLNGSHLAMAYLGALAGYALVHEVMQDALFTRFIEQFMEEVTPVVPLIPGTDVTRYKRVLIERFSNPAINDQVTRICSEGSAKMPKWVLPSIAELSEKGGAIELLSLVVASWIHYFRQGVNDRGAPLEIVDARKNELSAVAKSGGDDPRAMLGIKTIFGTTLPANQKFVSKVGRAMAMLEQHGAVATIEHYTAQGRLAD